MVLMWTRTTWTGLGMAACALAVVMWCLILVAQPAGQVLVWAGVLVLLVMVLAVKTLSVDDEQARDDARLHAAQQFQSACTHVGSDNEVVRSGGFYALGMIWRDWPGEHQRVLDYIQGWLQQHAVPAAADSTDQGTAGRRPAVDIQAALRELVRRPARPEGDPIDLARCALSDHDLREANLSSAILTKTELNRVNLAGAVLRDADLTGASLVEADLTSADLSGANLQRAQLVAATLTAVNLTGADIRGARLEQADLRETTGLTAAQLKLAQLDTNTVLPEGIDPDEVADAREPRRPY